MEKTVQQHLSRKRDEVLDLWRQELERDGVEPLPERDLRVILDVLSAALVEKEMHFPRLSSSISPVQVATHLAALRRALAGEFGLQSEESELRRIIDAALDTTALYLIETREVDSQGVPPVLKVHREYLDNVLDFADIGFFVLDPSGRVIFWGRGMERLYDVPAQHVLGKYLREAFPAFKEEPEFPELFERVIETGQPQEGVGIQHRSLKKGLRTLDLKLSPFRAADGRILGVSVLVVDVTERRAEEEALDRYRKYVQTILQGAADAIIVLDEQNRIVMWNKGAEELYGWKEEEVVGKPVTVIVPDDPRAQREIEQISEEVRRKGFIRNWQTERITRDGRRVLINLTRTAIFDREGKYIGSSVIARDITEQKRLEQQLIQSEKLSAVGQLAAGIAHEIGSPLTAVASLSQLLLEMSEDEFFRERLALIRKEVDRISRTVRELVDFSRPVTNKVERLDVNQIVNEAVRIVRYDRRLKHREIHVELAEGLPPVEVAFDQMLQVMVNLLLNAADAIEERDDGQVWIQTKAQDGHVVISVRDNGVGIPPENLRKIFDPFFTTKKAGKGTGLGLWVCYNIVQNFSGHIEVESEPGRGAEFRIVLPASVAERHTGAVA
ncbi:MAG: PAS domain-containing protein [Calditrichaeota bacterium]|nr:PAS domain-containing protein [Calditrichota bacterium]